MIDFVVDEVVGVAETVIHAAMVDRLKAALPLLSGSEQALINAIFFEELSEREVGLRLGVTQSGVNKRKFHSGHYHGIFRLYCSCFAVCRTAGLHRGKAGWCTGSPCHYG